jgi:sulfur carrier protein ThiS
MHIHVVLYSTLREKLPREAKGRTILDLPPGSTLTDLLTALDITIPVKCAVNGEIERDEQRLLQDGDEVQVFRPVGGGTERLSGGGLAGL